jgi:CheY-like chemotaxis protein
VLVAEDEPLLRELVSSVLGNQGYVVVEAANGVEAVQRWQEHQGAFDLLLTDMVMPEGLSGSDLVERFRKEKPGLKVVYMSGYSPAMAGRDVIHGDAEIFLQKPYRPDTLLQVVRECLNLPWPPQQKCA